MNALSSREADAGNAQKAISVAALKSVLATGTEYALFDVREAGEAVKGHIPGATVLPRRLIEFRLRDLVFRSGTLIVVYDDGGKDRRASFALKSLEHYGYRNVRALSGGVAAWANRGHALEAGSNVPSKRFGERLRAREDVPEVCAENVVRWQNKADEVLICDIRTPEEHEASNIPGAFSAPSFDCARFIGDFQQAGNKVIVHCAGRTRSIMACQTLRELGLDNVFALTNGTMGWVLSGHKLQRGNSSRGVMPSRASVERFEVEARRLAEREGITEIDGASVEALLRSRDGNGKENAYVFDVRPVGEFCLGHIAGATALPGGQAVQRADEFVAIKVAPIVFVDDREGRAIITAYWFFRMGYPNVQFLSGGLNGWMAAGRGIETGRGRREPMGLNEAMGAGRLLSVEQVHRRLKEAPETVIVYVDHSRNFATGHLASSHWVPRGSLEQSIGSIVDDVNKEVLLTCRKGDQSCLASMSLAEMGYTNVFVLKGGVAAWEERGMSLEKGGVPLSEVWDLVLPPYSRGKEGMERYLEWEQKLAESKKKEGSGGRNT